MSDAGAVLAVVGLGAILSFAQSTRLAVLPGLPKLIAPLQIGLAIGLVVRISISWGWWTMLVFIVSSLVVGALNGALMRSHGRHVLLTTQQICAYVCVVALGLCWFF